MIRIAIVGPESTGKSTLAGQLAEHYKTVFVPEIAREYINGLKRKYTLRDIVEISRLQIEAEDNMAASAKKIIFCDTNLVVTKIWAEFVFDSCPVYIEENSLARKYDLHLLTNIDFPWTPDSQREHPYHRAELFALYEKLLDDRKIRYEIISGRGEARFRHALRAVEKIYSPS